MNNTDGVHGTKACKNCKHFVWYSWWWPYYMGLIEWETKKECRHPDNHEQYFNPISGEMITYSDFEKTFYELNGDGNCAWFEEGKNEYNLEGRASQKDMENYKKHIAIQHEIRNRKWWQFWK